MNGVPNGEGNANVIRLGTENPRRDVGVDQLRVPNLKMEQQVWRLFQQERLWRDRQDCPPIAQSPTIGQVERFDESVRAGPQENVCILVDNFSNPLAFELLEGKDVKRRSDQNRFESAIGSDQFVNGCE